MPPNTAPTASRLPVRSSTRWLFRCLIMDTTDMDKTDSPDRKLMLLTLITPKASSTGLMITPPPMPQIPPMVEAARQMAKMISPTGIPSLRKIGAARESAAPYWVYLVAIGRQGVLEDSSRMEEPT